jgi:hypothetical protein
MMDEVVLSSASPLAALVMDCGTSASLVVMERATKN